MEGSEMLDKLRTMCGLVENVPKGVEFVSAKISDEVFGKSPEIHIHRGIELFREPVGLLCSTEKYNWLGFVSDGILVYQGVERDGGQI